MKCQRTSQFNSNILDDVTPQAPLFGGALLAGLLRWASEEYSRLLLAAPTLCCRSVVGLVILPRTADSLQGSAFCYLQERLFK